jgi:integrase
MTKRAHGEGSIYQLRSGSWRGLVTVNGQRISHTAKTRKEVLAWVRKTTSQVERGLKYDAARQNLGDYLTSWLASVENSVRPSTFEHYKLLVKNYLIPQLGASLIKNLSPDRIQSVYDSMIQAGTGAHTIIKTHAVLHNALQRASETGLAFRNAADLVRPPAAPEKEMSFWNEEETNRFLTVAQDSRLYALFYLAIVTGAWQMEVCGLQWADLDWLRGTLHIRRQLARVGEMFAQQKTRAAKCTINLGAKTLDVLRAHQQLQTQERILAGNRWQEYDLIFTSTIGTPLQQKNLVDRYFKPLVKLAGVPEIRFHDLRHTAASIMLSRGVSIFAVSKIIGHARPSITSDIYGHLVPGATNGVGEMMDELIAPVAISVEVHGGMTNPQR